MDFIKETYTVDEIDQMALKIKELRDSKKELESKLKEVNISLDLITESFSEAMAEVGKTKWTVDGVGSLTVSEKVYPRMNKDFNSVESLMTWLQSKGKDFYLSTASVNHMTLARILKEERAKDPSFEIPGVDSSFKRKTISLRSK